jgi:type II secretory pathway component PulF
MTLKQLGIFYRNLSQMHQAGIDFISVFSTFLSTEKNTTQKGKLKKCLVYLKSGRGLAQSLQASELIPIFDIPLLSAAEKAGNLQQVFENLARSYDRQFEAEKKIRSGLWQPLFTLCVALFVPSLPDLFTNKISTKTYMLHSFGTLGVILALLFGVAQFWQKSYYDISLARLRFEILSFIPLVSKLSEKSSLRNFADTLALMLESGIDITEALIHSGRCSPDERIQAATQRISLAIKKGQALAASFRQETVFPEDIQNSILLGHQSGKLPEFLGRSALRLRQEVEDGIAFISKIVPRILYGLVVLYVGYVIVKGQLGHMKELNDAIKDANI